MQRTHLLGLPPISSYCILTFHRTPLAAAPQAAAAALIPACETAHVPAALLPRLSLRRKCVAVAIAGTWQLSRSPWQWLSRGRPAQHTHPAATTARRQMQPGVAQKLLPTAAFPHDVQPITARAAWLRLCANGSGQAGESPHYPRCLLLLLGDIDRAQHASGLVRRLPLHNCAVPEVIRPGDTIAYGVAR
jgi:hypothetical protein